MSVPYTELALVPLVAGADPRDLNSKAGNILTRSNALTLAQPGCQRLWWGMTKEAPPLLIVAVGASPFPLQP